MRQLERERRGVWFSKYEGKTQLVDEEGRLTGEWGITYSKPQRVECTVSPRTGNTWGDGFGIGVDCDRTLVVPEVGLGIDETCVMWVDVRPELDSDGNAVLDDEGNFKVPNDYTVTMAGESFNFTSVAIKKASE